jgi:ferredoxin
VARLDLRDSRNAEGDWFVDTRCIDCGTCRDIAPRLFTDTGGASVIRRQPDDAERLDAWLAAQACPANSIGTRSRQPRPGRLYPREIEAGSGVFDRGYCSEERLVALLGRMRRPARRAS